LVFITSLFEENLGLGYLKFKNPSKVKQVRISGKQHNGKGELQNFMFVNKNKYLLEYNIDGCSWLYEAEFNEDKLIMSLGRVITGKGKISNGVLESVSYDKRSDSYILSHSTATAPTQLFTIEGKKRKKLYLTHMKVFLGFQIPTFLQAKTLRFQPMMVYAFQHDYICHLQIQTIKCHILWFITSMVVPRVKNGQILPGFPCRSFNF
jgi:hypothetical protein